jgi:hypothetical protein
VSKHPGLVSEIIANPRWSGTRRGGAARNC